MFTFSTATNLPCNFVEASRVLNLSWEMMALNEISIDNWRTRHL